MAQAFAVKRVGEAVWPELAALGVLGLGHLVARAVDGVMVWERPGRRLSDGLHASVLAGSLYFLGTNRAPNVSQAVLYGDSMLLLTAGGDWMYQKTVGPQVAQVKARRIADQRVTGRHAVGEAEQILQKARVEAARIIAAAKGGGNPGALIPVGQYADDEIRA